MIWVTINSFLEEIMVINGKSAWFMRGCTRFFSPGKRAIKAGEKYPAVCVVICRACAKTCHVNALSFLEKAQTVKSIKQIRKEDTNGESLRGSAL